ncbi:membrane protein insertion efficiency factor YidD [Spartinivicinus ruber]|uniref:membrane protein insertion efficiency factor YidD n=1 Tax=Spartinivicinus ruber TaxID=2683272 RepID=UPI0013D6BA93|nr:membrane protein insertion efficiency factor YidD [Spartinivicinus ruber]
MKWLLIGLIRCYQRWISPYKGFSCAHAVYHQGRSCSAEAIYLLEQYGMVVGYQRLVQRFQACRRAYQQLITEDPEQNDQRRRRRRRDKDSNKFCDSCDCLDIVDCKPELPCDISPCDIGPCH